MKRLQEYLMQYHNPKILDVGTGRGNFIQLIKMLSNNFQEIIGTDLDDRLLQSNRESFKDDLRIKFVNDNILETKLSEGYFDIICLSNTVHHLEDLTDTYRGMSKLLNKDGIIIINEMIADNLNPAQISHKLLHHFAAKVDREIGRVHDETYNRDDLIGKITDLAKEKVVDVWDMIFEDDSIDYDFNPYENLLDHLVKIVANKENANDFKEEADEIKEYIKSNGFKSATQVVIIIKK